MYRKFLNLRNVAITACLVGVTFFTSCGENNNPQIKEVTSIELNKTTLSLEVGQTETLIATVLPADATDKSVTWTSSNATVASVENGVVTANTAGVATIIAKAGDQIAICEVTVLNVVISVESITLNETTLSFFVGQTETLTATVLPADATDKSVTWTSSNATVASVTNGVVTANAAGTATITAKAGNKTATCAVSVIDGVLINGVIWAKYNVSVFDTFASAPESSGMFYQWNRPTAWAATGNISGWNNSFPAGNTWATANDPCPSGWRVPTQAELQSLFNSGSTWTTQNGVNGRRFGTAPNQIFLPAAGYRNNNDGALFNAGSYGKYWSSTEGISTNAYYLNFDSGSGNANLNDNYKTYGFSVRCVAE